MKKGLLFVPLLISVAVLSCKHDAKTDPSPVNPADTTQQAADPANPKFTTDILPIFTANCNGCHNNVTPNDGYNFTSYQTTIAKKFVPGNLDETKLYSAITDNNDDDRMPQAPNPRLPADKILLIRNWILNGAPNN